MQYLREHALSIVVITIWLSLVLASYILYDKSTMDWLSERAGGHSDDAFGAMLIIVLTKWLRERGKNPSEESK